MDYTQLASPERVQKTTENLKKNGIEAFFVQTGAEAKAKVLELLPAGAEVMNMTSRTVDAIGLTQEIMESGRFQAVRKRFETLDKVKDASLMRKLGAAPDYAVGSVHAITEDGQVLIASMTGSQLPAYVYGAGKVLWVAGTQKIVSNLEEGLKRLREHTLVLESQRVKQVYGIPGSSIDKLLTIYREITAGRMTLILVNEVLGF